MARNFHDKLEAKLGTDDEPTHEEKCDRKTHVRRHVKGGNTDIDPNPEAPEVEKVCPVHGIVETFTPAIRRVAE